MINDRVGYLIKRTQQSLRLAMDSELRHLSLTTAQYAALSALEEQSNASNAALARACFVTPQTMIEIIQSLQKAGFVTRQSHPEHGRIIQTILTPDGLSKLAAAHKIIENIEDKMLSGLKAEERETLALHLQKCCESLEGRSLETLG